MHLMSMNTITSSTTVGQKRELPVSEPDAVAAASASSVMAAGHDDDGEEILVEAEPLPHEIATDPSLRCRYPSKHCLRMRTIKKTGALHSMCAFHRAKANRNQRRLEKRKRLRLNSTDSVAESMQLSAVDAVVQHHQIKQEPSMTLLMPAFSPNLKSFMDGSMASSVALQFQSPREVASEFEPFRMPAALFPEDLEELCELVDVNVRQVCADPSEEDIRLLSQLLL
ncbi:hypothetical protein F441_02199 [Phytophthora nicotianae CJ01A1]|uniref:Uncharacterized protein n=9 Tax=Phytophthora nicotianae TaxID=4792 RepID=V9FU87_PHYNI|nr:hypothetical protein PPTG_07059 [Phytophthora nicotianae INRA-310]ETI55045.1 hypothetical protein F443_02227 [Phytophthora nicotianae P1569]ETK94884.1 hypothetical protein L915_02136 [Phytophthora nicotianae]ETP24880.1 hypothetical protein F441_02199 [Phytophthora nicotianae CJ01A1]ETI55065.1 hypothetical protein F443_02226 [Phytophthora nicotianae P1569]ETL48276.1 hypothetical protein L916_02100 [Phytophthora nicotianae]